MYNDLAFGETIEERCFQNSSDFSAGAGFLFVCSFVFLRPTLMETRCYKVFVPNYSKTKSAEDTLAPSLLGKREKNVCFLNISCSFFHKISFVHAAARGGTCALTLKIVNTLIENSSRDDRTSISTLNQPTANPLRVGQGQ